MIDFEYSTKAIWNIFHRDTFYARFVSEETVEDAIQLIYEKSNTAFADLDLLTKLRHTNVPTFIYASGQDRVVDITGLQDAGSKNVSVKRYEQLNHIEMVALVSLSLMSDFASDLLERRVSESDVETIGILCEAADLTCLRQIDKTAKK